MKKIFTIFILLASTVVFSQDFQFEEVIKVDSLVTKDELFNRARSWIGQTFNNEKYVIATEDRVNGELSGNGSMYYNPGRLFFGSAAAQGEIDYKINIFVKDGRYKYKFYAFRHAGTNVMGNPAISYGMITTSTDAPKPSRGGANNKAWKDIKEQTAIKIKKTIESLKEAMNKKYEGSKEW